MSELLFQDDAVVSHILIIIAMEAEAQPLLDHFKLVLSYERIFISSFHFI
jgi:hypothetical protein